MSFVDNVLEHHGIKGMRWGVRKDRGGVTTGRFGRKAKPIPSEDKVTADTARAKIGRKGNTDALSNQELQTVIARMNLEQQIARLSANQKKGGAVPFVTKVLKDTAKSEFDGFTKGKETLIIGSLLGNPSGRHRKIPKPKP
jgi:hypothetical protein